MLASISLTTAGVVVAIWDRIGASRIRRYAAAVIGSGLLALLLANVGVNPYGNVQIAMDWSGYQSESARLRAALPPDTVVFTTHDTYPVVSSLLGRPFVLQSELLSDDIGSWAPRYLLATAVDTNPLYQKAQARYCLIQRTSYGGLFEIR